MAVTRTLGCISDATGVDPRTLLAACFLRLASRSESSDPASAIAADVLGRYPLFDKVLNGQPNPTANGTMPRPAQYSSPCSSPTAPTTPSTARPFRIHRSIRLNGNLVVRGRVNGGVEEAGAGGISLLAGANVNGEVTEFDGGNVVIRGGATLGGDVRENNAGSFEGSVFENNAGNVEVTIAAGTVFKGGIEEEQLGSVIVYVDGRFEGNLTELDDGNLSTAGSGTVAGNSEHELPGRCGNTVPNFEGAICTQL